MMKLLGIYHSRTTAYHRSANSIVERFHRQLKASLMAANSNSNWLEALPLVLLDIRSTVKEDAMHSSWTSVWNDFATSRWFLPIPKAPVHNTIADPHLTWTDWDQWCASFLLLHLGTIEIQSRMCQMPYPRAATCSYDMMPLSSPYNHRILLPSQSSSITPSRLFQLIVWSLPSLRTQSYHCCALLLQTLHLHGQLAQAEPFAFLTDLLINVLLINGGKYCGVWTCYACEHVHCSL